MRAGAKPGRWARNSPPDAPPHAWKTRSTNPSTSQVMTFATVRCVPGRRCPEPSNYLSEIQREGKPLGADLVYRETWQWLDQRGCSHFVAPRLIEAYAQAFARYVQCEQAISKFGLLGKHPTTGAAIASPFVAMSQSFGKQANVYWYEIYEIVRATCTTDYAGTTPGEEVMEQLLNAHY